MTMFTIRRETRLDVAPREALLDEVMGEARFTRTAARLRENRLPAEGLSFVARASWRLIGAVQLWDISAGPGRPALLLGPLAVVCDRRNRGVGTALVHHALDEARRRGHGVVLLVGDAPYYGRFGFSSEKTQALWLPGPYERHRLLALELVDGGALDGARGLVHATGRFASTPDLPALVAGVLAHGPGLEPHRDSTLLAPRAA